MQTHTRVAILYSGRFYGDYTPTWYAHHLSHIIWPNNASVYITITSDNWCHAPVSVHNALRNGRVDIVQQTFALQVATAFHGWPKLQARFIPHNQNSITLPKLYEMLANTHRQIHLKRSGFYQSLYHKWYLQWSHYGHVDHFLREHSWRHDVLVRMRLDIAFERPPHLPQLRDLTDSHVFGLGYYAKVSFQVNLGGERCDEQGRKLISREAILEKVRTQSNKTA